MSFFAHTSGNRMPVRCLPLLDLKNKGQENQPFEFVMRLMSLRQKVKSVSATDPCPFEEEIIDRKFKTSVVSGIKNESIRSQLREVLKNPQVTDQDLLYNLTFIVTNETEHNQKFRPQQREVATSLVETKQERSNKLFDEFAALKLEVCQLRG